VPVEGRCEPLDATRPPLGRAPLDELEMLPPEKYEEEKSPPPEEREKSLAPEDREKSLLLEDREKSLPPRLLPKRSAELIPPRE
jgi:hypothetical protein